MTATQIHTTCISREILSQYVHDFDGLRDSRNRQIGVRVEIAQKTFVPTDGDSYWTNVEPGVHFYVNVRQLRGGLHYGATPCSSKCKTLEEAQQKAEQIIAKRRKEYTKKFAQQ